MKKNDVYTVEITDLTNLGFGVAKIDGRVVFVSGTVTGDIAKIKIIKLQSSYAVARLEELIEASPLRAKEKRCNLASCHSCAYREIEYTSELCIKREIVRHAFIKEGLDTPVADIIGSPKIYGYRNKAQYPVSKNKDGEYVIGFFKPKSHSVCEAAACPLAPEIFGDILEGLRRFFKEYSLPVYDEESCEGLIRHVYLRRGEISGEILLVLVLTEATLPHSDELVARLSEKFPDIVGILINVNDKETNVILGEKYVTLYGRDYIYDTLSGVRLKLTAPSFYQVNHDAAELLYAKARELAALMGDEMLLDLYCGVGSIGLSMAEDAGELIGIEIVPSAVKCAEENALASGIRNAKFFTGDAADTERLLAKAESALGRKIEPDVIILDPPRAGCDERLLKFISGLTAQRIVYISCNPATLARDVRILSELGFAAGEVTPVDLFPGTGHVESVVSLTRGFDN